MDILKNEACAKYFSEVEEFSINRKSPRKTPSKSNESTPVASSGSRGRPRNLFCDLAKSQKNKRTSEIASNFDTDELCASTIRSLKETGQATAAKVIKLTTAPETTPTKPAKFLKDMKTPTKPARKLTPDEACAMFIRNKLTVRSYKDIKMTTDEVGHHVYPSWDKVYKSKMLCYPSDDHIHVSEDSAEVDFDKLVEHTYKRLCELLEGDIVKCLSEHDVDYFGGDIKVGSDGTSGLGAFKMMSASGTLKEKVYFSCMCPLTLKAYYKGKEVKTLWENPTPCSTRFCRPIKFDFVAESKAVTIAEKERLFECFRNVPTFDVPVNGVNIVFKFDTIT